MSRSVTSAPTPRLVAAAFLLRRLRGGPQPALRLLTAASRAGIDESWIDRARRTLGVTATKGQRGVWWWALPAPDKEVRR